MWVQRVGSCLLSRMRKACAVLLQASEEPYSTAAGNAHIDAPGAHTGVGGPGLKACSKCKMAKPLVEYFKDKSKPDSLYSQVSLHIPRSFTGLLLCMAL